MSLELDYFHQNLNSSSEVDYVKWEFPSPFLIFLFYSLLFRLIWEHLQLKQFIVPNSFEEVVVQVLIERNFLIGRDHSV